MVVAGGYGTARDGDQMGRLSARQGLAIARLSLVVQHHLQSALLVQLPHTDGGGAADAQSRADLLVGPALGGFEQDAGASEGAVIGFAGVDECLQRGSVGFGQRHGKGDVSSGTPWSSMIISLLSIANWTDYYHKRGEMSIFCAFIFDPLDCDELGR